LGVWFDVATTSVKSRRGRVLGVAAVAVSVLLLACLGSASAGSIVNGSPNALAGPNKQRTTTAPRQSTTPAVLQVSPANLAVDVEPNAPVSVKASSGTLRVVTLVDAKGNKVEGQTSPDGTWGTDELLRPSTAYTFAITAIGPDGMPTTIKSTFRTLRPQVSATYALMPSGGTVGVGMPVILQFDTAVDTKARRAEVEKRVKVTSVPDQVGAWGWLDDRQLMWRPQNYWLPGTKVTVSTPLHGVQTGDNKWITIDGETSFTVGPSMVSSVDMRAHNLTVRLNGKVIRTFLVSTGRPGPLTETRSGIKVIMSRNPVIVMDSATIGIPPGSPGYYKITTQWDLRLTWTGEFIHSAPWSVGAQGSQNVSHGCTNMAPADAQWMFNNSKVGDVVTFKGSSRVFKAEEGIGVWVYDYAGWMARSALA
jgi:lipoprotein-anchoring transpeptidase ErfK/SrfK